MAVYGLSVNDFNVSDLTGEKEYKSASIAPSTLLPNPSQAFARQLRETANEGVYSIQYIINDTTLTLTSLKGFLKSSIGLHYIELLTSFNFDLSGYNDGDYNFYVGYEMYENDSITTSADLYNRDKLSFEITQNDPTIENPIKIGTINKNGTALSYAPEVVLSKYQFDGDLVCLQDIYGLVIIDRADNTKKWRVFVNSGNFGIEEVK